jgi:hypothetical protein
MPYALYREKRRVSPLFNTEGELWVHVRESGLCAEALENEDMPARRVLNPEYLIYTCEPDGTSLGDAPLKSWR